LKKAARTKKVKTFETAREYMLEKGLSTGMRMAAQKK
jgi:hypothetical protein